MEWKLLFKFSRSATDVDVRDMAGTADHDVQDGTGAADGNNSANNGSGPNGGTPSLGVSIDLSSLFRPPTRPVNPTLPSTFILAGDPFMQPVGPKKLFPSMF